MSDAVSKINAQILEMDIQIQNLYAERKRLYRDRDELRLQEYLESKGFNIQLHVGDKLVVTEQSANNLGVGSAILPIGTQLILAGVGEHNSGLCYLVDISGKGHQQHWMVQEVIQYNMLSKA